MEEVRDQGSDRTTGIRRVAGIGMALAALSVSALTVGTAAAASTPSIRLTTVTTPGGKVLTVGSATVYTLKASSTACAAACLVVWPAVMVPHGAKHAMAGSGVSSSKLGTAKVSGGLQVTYGGKRLYTFTGDSGKGQVNGNITDTWGKWTAVVISKPASNGSGSSSTSTSSNAGSGGASF
jgi:predicted lipoprotein with Yx(FWY)xxD motif